MMKKRITKHYALVPAKKTSARCKNKNWRKFVDAYSLVDYTIAKIPKNIFKKVIISTNKRDYKVSRGVEVHKRSRSMAAKRSCIKEVMQLIILEYGLRNKDYLWLLNPTSPFRRRGDYLKIKNIIKQSTPVSVISAARINPFIWKGDMPLFEIVGGRPRRNIDDFAENYRVENGMFYVVNVGYFKKHNSWYGQGARLYEQKRIDSFIDIDTEDEFLQAQMVEKLCKKSEER